MRKCPLQAFSADGEACIGEGCGWFDDDADCCGTLTLVVRLEVLAGVVRDLGDKLASAKGGDRDASVPVG